MVLSDLILGWSHLVTGHADSSIISYLKMLHVRFSLFIVLLWNWSWRHIFNIDGCDCHRYIVAPALIMSSVGDFFGISSLWEKQILSHIKKKDKSQQQTRHRGYGMYCQWLLLQFNGDMLRENPTCVTFTILDICRSVQQVFFLFFLPVQVNTPAGLKGQEVTR